MTVTITVPHEIAAVLGQTPDERVRRAAEAIALQLYREGRISLRVMGRTATLGDDYWAADELRARHHIPLACEEPASTGNTGDAASVDALLRA